MNGSTKGESIGLAELIYQVKRELLSPEARARDPVPVFAVDEIQVEAAVTVRRDASGGINIQVLSLGGGVGRDTTQTVRVTLKPLRTREELLADLRAQSPELLEDINARSLDLLKSALRGEEHLDYPG